MGDPQTKLNPDDPQERKFLRTPRAKPPAIRDKPCEVAHAFKWRASGATSADICDRCGWSRAEVDHA